MKFIAAPDRIEIVFDDWDTSEERNIVYTATESLKALLNALAAKVEREDIKC